MAFVLLFLGVLLLATASALLVRTVALSRVRVASQLRRIQSYGFTADTPAAPEEERRSLLVRLSPLAERIGRLVSGESLLAPVAGRTLRAAGIYEVSSDAVQGYRVAAALGIPGFLLFISVAGGSLRLTSLLMLLAAAGVCWILPPILIKSRGERRMDQLDRALPELIDLLIATVEAGLGFAGSLQLVASRFKGPLGQELRLMLHQQRMGLPTTKGLENLVERCDTPSIRAFTRAITQAESLGISIGTMLRNLASDTRKRRRQAAREKIMKAPIKMLFPLVFLVFPCLFIVLLYPATANLIAVLGGG